MIEQMICVNNKEGLHARPAAILIKEANRYKSTIEIEFNGRVVSSKSIISLMTLKVKQGETVKLYIYGEDEVEAAASILSLFENNFGEKE
ncbi:MAG: HPr family phosphocarrier protein [Bacillota bacterium]